MTEPDSDAVLIRASRNIFSKRYLQTRSVFLPINLDYRPNAGSEARAFGFVVLTAIFAVIGWNVNSVPADVASATSAFLTLVYVRASITRHQKVSGSLTVTRHEFWDTRLTSRPVAWAVCTAALMETVPRLGTVTGVRLCLSNHAGVLIIGLQRGNKLKKHSRTAPSICIELEGFSKARDYADSIIKPWEESRSTPGQLTTSDQRD